MQAPDFWQDVDNSSLINSELTSLKKETNDITRITGELASTNELLSLAISTNDESLYNELTSIITTLDEDISSLELSTLLNGPYDSLNCYLEIHPGAGGTESCDWSSMLLRMY